MRGSRATLRRRRLRRFANNRKAYASLELLVKLSGIASDRLITSSSLPNSGTTKNHRDVFPLPLPVAVSSSVLDGVIPRFALKLIDRLVVGSAIGLNFLHTSKRAPLCEHRPNHAQMSVFKRLVCKWWQLALHMGSGEAGCTHDPLALSRLIAKGSGGAAIPLQADRIDSLIQCGQVDPSPHLHPDVRSALNDPSRFVNFSVAHSLPTVCRPSGDRREYINLIRQQCRANKVVLSTTCSNAAPCFAVGKADGRQREVWHGKAFSEACCPPPSPPFLACPSDLGSLECTDSQPLLMSVRDGQSFFDQLGVPTHLRPWFGKPWVTVSDLCGVGESSASSERAAEFHPLSEEELLNSLLQGTKITITPTTKLTPLAACWPMGSSWASMIAQSVMTSFVKRVGVEESQFLCADNGLPPIHLPSISVATDDVVLFERMCGLNMEPGSLSPILERLDASWECHNVKAKAAKSVNRQLDGTALGMDLVNGRFLLPKRSRLVDIVSSLIIMLTLQAISPADLGHAFGVVQWLLLANRPLLSCCCAIYGFVMGHSVKIQSIPKKALDELATIALLLPYLVLDLRSEWAPYIVATDGAESYGYGATIAKCDPLLAREAASFSRKSGHAFILADCDAERCRTDAEKDEDILRLPLKSSDFKIICSSKCRNNFHASKLEMGALCLAIKLKSRQRRWHGHRLFGLVDSKALLGAVRKGRSGAGNFYYGSRVLASLLLSTETQLHLGYVPSTSNPADKPSRGRARTHDNNQRKRAMRFVEKPARCEVELRRIKSSYRYLAKHGVYKQSMTEPSWSSSCSASTLAQP